MQDSCHIIESFVAAKRPDGVSEDMVENLGSFVVVLDGVTGKDGATYRGLTGGRFAAEVVMDAMRSLAPTASAREALDHVSTALHEAIVSELGFFPPHPPGTQFSAYSTARGEVWRVGDIHVRINDKILPTPAPPTDEIATEFRAALLEAYLAGGASEEDLIAVDPSWDVLLPLLSRQDFFANDDSGHHLGYGVVNGGHVPDRHVSVLSVHAGSEVVLCTDGYFSPSGTLASAEEDLQQVLATDRLLIRSYKGFRPAPLGGSFDDRGWMRFTCL